MDLELDGRTAAVIGGSSGIGAAVVGVLAEEGCDVVVTYRRSRAGAQQAAADVRAHGRRAWVVHLELGRPGSATKAAEMLSAQLGGLDAFVLCAGYNVLTWIANWLISTTFPALSDIGLGLAYGIYTVSAILSFFLVVRFVCETKGKELEEMRA